MWLKIKSIISTLNKLRDYRYNGSSYNLFVLIPVANHNRRSKAEHHDAFTKFNWLEFSQVLLAPRVICQHVRDTQNNILNLIPTKLSDHVPVSHD